MKKILSIVLSLSLCVLFLSSCENRKSRLPEYPIEYIELGGSFPDLVTKNLGLGDLYKYDIPNLLIKHYENENLSDINFYASSDMSKYFSYSRKKNLNKWNLEQICQDVISKKHLTEYSCRVGDSEVFSKQDFKVPDVFYTDFIILEDASPLFLQECIFIDGEDLLFFEFGYRCFTAQAGYSGGVNVRVPTINEPQIFEDKFSWNNVRYTFDNITEIPTIILMSTEEDIEVVLRKVVAENSSIVSRKKIDGMDVYVTEDQHIVYGDVEYERARGYIINNKGVVSCVTFCDPIGVNSHAFDALEKGITKPY